MVGGDSKFANFTLPTLKAFLEARSHNVSGNKQQPVTRAIGCPKTHFLNTNSRSSGQPKNDAKTFSPHPPAPFLGNLYNCNSIAILGSTSTVIHSVKQRLLRNRPGSALRPLATSCAKDYKAHSL